MVRFEVTEKTGYSTAWVALALLFIAGVVVWFKVSAMAAVIIAAIGLIAAAFYRWRGNNRVGDHIELNDNGIIFCESGESHCIAFNEIKLVKCTKFMGFGDEAYLIETSVGRKKNLNPQDYENPGQLREKLLKGFTTFNCRMLQ